ncbi:GcrA family cell cycle regulator [Azorhizobium doebereinerae]|uniref:GcrA family cell cycle regulator n=1 Tax=Azorhizobium doebereinerae TaxID=281091 RepID=UPI0012EB6114
MSVWSEEVLAAAEPLVRAGETYGRVASVVSQQFGVVITRNAMISKASRMGWVQAKKEPVVIGARVTPARRGKKPVCAASPPLSAPAPAAPPPVAAPEPPSPGASRFGPGVPLMTAKAGECRYIFSATNEDGAICCGRRVVPGTSWCPSCSVRVFEPRQSRDAKPKVVASW